MPVEHEHLGRLMIAAHRFADPVRNEPSHEAREERSDAIQTMVSAKRSASSARRCPGGGVAMRVPDARFFIFLHRLVVLFIQ